MACLQQFVTHPSVTPEQKMECLKLLKVIVKNLVDPIKSQDEKYQKLRLSNPKLQQKLVPFPLALEYLQKEIGFEQVSEHGDDYLVLLVPNKGVEMSKHLANITQCLNKLQQQSCAKAADNVRGSNATTKLSEKQKARILLEKQQEQEKQKAKLARKRSIEQIKQDKYVRQNDANWKAGACAASTKNGDGISTFRDKYGE